jgi:cyclopropane fatty-acyl-phospholipid synthase-like methyltransferase
MSVPVSLPPTTQAHLDGVRRYYEQNTRLFMALGNDRAMHTIHRALWAEGVHDLESALNYSSELILAEIRSYERDHPTQALTVLDLGCGVGGSLFYLARHYQRPGSSATLSPTQAWLPIAAPGCQSSSLFVEGIFLIARERGGGCRLSVKPCPCG